MPAFKHDFRALLLPCLFLCASSPLREASAAADSAGTAAEILEATGVRGGIILHLGVGNGALTGARKVNDSYQVQGLDRDPANVDQARAAIQAAGNYGEVSVDLLDDTGRLPYVDNLINLIVAESDPGISDEEILRVLAPRGVAYIKDGKKWTTTAKPVPDNIDEWTHYLHSASGNAVAKDDAVGPPRHLQWLGSPRWSRHHDRVSSINAVVTAGGRMFYIDDEGSRTSILLPSKWTLVARDAFNGTVLWKKPLEGWHDHLWPLKSGSTAMARRLVAVGDRVYITLGIGTPLSALDAATGEVIQTYEGTAVEEAIYSEGTLFILDNPGEWELADFAPKLNTGDQARVKTEYAWNQAPRKITAIDAESGKVLWVKESKTAPLTLSANPEAIFYHDGERVQALERDSGETMWSSEPTTQRTVFNMNFGPKLVLHDDVVLFAGGDKKMRALNVRTGKTVWEAPHGQSGYQSPEDILVAGGVVWNAPTTSGKDSGIFTGRNPSTGEVVGEFAPDVETYRFHHRCYIAKGTDNFLMTSRTGNEFVDPRNKTWDINHWVRGSCLYGIMPANGLVYAPPHNCACYPETKLYGINAPAPAATSRDIDASLVSVNRLQKGEGFSRIQNSEFRIQNSDLPTYRGDNFRSGHTTESVAPNIQKKWEANLPGRLTPVTVAGGALYVAQVDRHLVHSLDAATGKPNWTFTAGARVDSPPSIAGGAVYFGSTDGYVYCVRASDGALAWRFRVAPNERRLGSFEQIESVWPVHGSVLVQDGKVHAVAGRSNFLDEGLRMVQLDAATGELLSEKIIDEKNPETGNNIQEKIATLQMPAGLADILSSDGEHLYMRSQRFDLEGNREEIGPVSGEFAEQGGTHDGIGQHLFAPMGFLDDTWFHPSYWVYGKNFAGGHGGYFQAGKYAPSGRILVHDEENVYGFARKPEYLKWTTTIEHQLFAASREIPVIDDQAARRGASGTSVQFAKSDSLNPAKKSIALEAWVKPEEDLSGPILVRGGPSIGFGLILQQSAPAFFVRSDTDKITTAKGDRKVPDGEWIHLAGTLTGDGQVRLFVNGDVAATAKGAALFTKDPAQPMEVGGDTGPLAGPYKKDFAFSGAIDEVKLHYGSFSAAEIEAHFATAGGNTPVNTETVLDLSFEGGSGKDASGFENNGEIIGAVPSKGKEGDALRFAAKASRQGGSNVVHYWDVDLPLLARSMVLAGDTLFVAGPPDLIDEEEAFTRLTEKDPAVEPLLARQDAALGGAEGGLLRAVDKKTGATLAELKLDGLPVWDGLAVGGGRLYLSTTDGRVVCLGAK